jgi:predicted MFS family arabinose efflux permease
VQAELFQTFAGLSLAVFTVPQLAAIVLDPPALLVASRFSRRRAMATALCVYALALGLAATTRSPWLFALAWTAASIATGIFCGFGQSELIQKNPGREERAMAEWTLGSAVGDVAGPLLLAAAASTQVGFRESWWLVALIALGWAWLLERPRSSAARPASAGANDPDADDAPTKLRWRELYEHARTTPGLFAWLLATTLCSLMDETLVALCALWMQERFGSASALTLGVLSLMVGGLLGLVALHRLSTRVSPARLLLLAALGAALTLALWLASSSLSAALGALFWLGFWSAMHYPLAQAAAYRCLPSNSDAVAALSQFFGPIDLLIPLALGLLADRFGLGVAIAGLALQPLALVLATLKRWRP